MYEKMVRDLERENVFFEGVQNPMDYYRKAKIFAMTSSWEGLPMTILESFQKGVVPVVMDSFPSAKDMVEDGENGYLVNDGDMSAFVNRLQFLMANNDEVKRLAMRVCGSSDMYKITEIGAQWMKLFYAL